MACSTGLRRAHWLGKIAAPSDGLDRAETIDLALEGIAATLERELDISALIAIAKEAR